ncbi:hypothetical protein NHX12_014051 [Muraenolepis orangiensis]|uniref:Uncharacterized protein n=1 Tax=Muraenolepis orangiensis TaxID=630683 RepID=A0A9Q0DB93_9TELE|nr:hypothetical protein NHX12_014051 [Muraenolepis orangiensis]
MFQTLPTFPKHSETPGLPATNQTAEPDDWQAYRNTIWTKGFGTFPGLQHMWIVKEIPSSDREIMLSMLPPCHRHALSPGFPSAARLTDHSLPPDKDGPEVVGQKMTSKRSFSPEGSIVTDLTSAHSELSGDKYSSGNKVAKETLLQPNATQVPFNKKEGELQRGLVSGGHKVEKGFWTVSETEAVVTLEEGIPGFPSARMITSSATDTKDRIHDTTTPLLKNPQKKKRMYIAEWTAEDKENQKHLTLMAPSCPSGSRIPGFPSILPPTPSENQAVVCSVPTSDDSKPHGSELGHAQQVQSSPIEAGSIASTRMISPAVEHAYEVKSKESSEGACVVDGYETVASILAPSSCGAAEAVQPKGSSSSVDPESKDSTLPCEGFSLLSADNIALIEKANLEGLSESESESKHGVELQKSAEPYAWDLAEDRSASASPTSESDDGSLVVVGSSRAMKKWPPLTEAEIDEISKTQLEGAESKERIPFHSWDSKDRLFTEQGLGQTSVEGEPGCEAEIVQKVTEPVPLDDG